MQDLLAIPQYLQIAQDLSTRIANGEFSVGARLYGRSMLASQYGVSPETIRRALCLLADMKVVETKPQSGTVVLSVDSARRFLTQFSIGEEERSLQAELHEIMRQYGELHRRLVKLIGALVESHLTRAAQHDPAPTFEVVVPRDSLCVGKSIGALRFWQQTGATIAAIRRGRSVILSPGPYAELYEGDALVLVGTADSARAANRLLAKKRKEGANDRVSKRDKDIRQDKNSHGSEYHN